MAQPRITWEWNPEATPFQPLANLPHVSEIPTPEETPSSQQLAHSPISEHTTPRSNSNNTPVQTAATPLKHPVYWFDEELDRWGDAYPEIGDDDHVNNTPPDSLQQQQQQQQQQYFRVSPQYSPTPTSVAVPIRRKRSFIRRKSIFFPPSNNKISPIPYTNV